MQHQQETSLANRPRPGMMYGLTHNIDGTAIVREPKVLKVGIGLPKGKALNVWMHHDAAGNPVWKLTRGAGKDAQTAVCKSRAEAEEKFWKNIKEAPVVNYPRKVNYFTFTRPEMQEDGSELFVPDFEAIERMGPMPNEIDIIFLNDDPFTGSYQMWSSAELQCRGDGINAERIVKLTTTPEQQEAAKLALAAGQKRYIVANGCWTLDCPFSKEFEDKGKLMPSPCKPGGDLKFQLATHIRVGGTAYFHTTGYRSISQIFSSIFQIKTLTGGRLAGIPLKMCLRPYKTVHNGRAATQYGVSLEFRAEDLKTLTKNLIEQALSFRALAEGRPYVSSSPAALLGAADDSEIPVIIGDEVGDEEEEPISAGAMAAEFYPEATPEVKPEEKPAEAAKSEKTASLAERMKVQTEKAVAVQTEKLPAAAPAISTDKKEDLF